MGAVVLVVQLWLGCWEALGACRLGMGVDTAAVVGAIVDLVAHRLFASSGLGAHAGVVARTRGSARAEPALVAVVGVCGGGVRTGIVEVSSLVRWRNRFIWALGW